LSSAQKRLRTQAQRVAAGTAGDPPSPCISVCRMNDTGDFCEGCMRTLEEIAAWGRMADTEKRAVWREIAQRIENKGDSGE